MKQSFSIFLFVPNILSERISFILKIKYLYLNAILSLSLLDKQYSSGGHDPENELDISVGSVISTIFVLGRIK